MKSVLIFDDDDLNRIFLKAVFEVFDCEVTTVVDGYEGLEVVRELQPALIMMDLQMPSLDGFEVTRRLKADPATAHIPVIAISAYDKDTALPMAFAAGCDDYIAKPVRLHDIRAQVEPYLK